MPLEFHLKNFAIPVRATSIGISFPPVSASIILSIAISLGYSLYRLACHKD